MAIGLTVVVTLHRRRRDGNQLAVLGAEVVANEDEVDLVSDGGEAFLRKVAVKQGWA